jgi:hypothetical protein
MTTFGFDGMRPTLSWNRAELMAGDHTPSTLVGRFPAQLVVVPLSPHVIGK